MGLGVEVEVEFGVEVPHKLSRLAVVVVSGGELLEPRAVVLQIIPGTGVSGQGQHRAPSSFEFQAHTRMTDLQALHF